MQLKEDHKSRFSTIKSAWQTRINVEPSWFLHLFPGPTNHCCWSYPANFVPVFDFVPCCESPVLDG